METFDIEKSVIAREDLTDGVDFIGEFVGELKDLPGKLAGSENETACARAIRNRLHDESEVKTRLEAYYAYPMLGRGSLPFLGLWYLLSLALYYVSFAGGRVAGALLTALALVVFLSGGIAIMSLFLGKKTLSGLLTKKVSYNVVSEFSKGKAEDIKRTFVIVDNHDAKMGGLFGDSGIIRKLTILVAPISAFLFVLFCILKMSIGFDTVAKITAFTVLPAIFVLLGAFALVTHYSPFSRHAKDNNGVATAVSMATYAYFVEHEEKLPEDTKIVYVSLGGENAAHGGSQAFLKAHADLASAKVLCFQDITSGDIKVVECDPVRKIEFSTPIVSIVRSSAHEQGIELSTVQHSTLPQIISYLHGYTSNDFAKNGVQTATIVANRQTDHVLDRNDVEKLFSLAVGSFEKMFSETEKTVKEQTVGKEPSSNMEIKDVASK